MVEVDLRDDLPSCDLDELRHRLERLEGRAAALAGRIDAAAKALSHSGAPVGDELLAELQSYGGEFRALGDALVRAARDARLDDRLTMELVTVSALRQLSEWLGKHLDQVRGGRERLKPIGAALDRLMTLGRRDGGPLPTIELFRQQISGLVAQVADSARSGNLGDLGTLLERVTPYESLDRLAQERSSLSMEDALELSRAAEMVADPQIVWGVATGYIVPGQPATSPAPGAPERAHPDEPETGSDPGAGETTTGSMGSAEMSPARAAPLPERVDVAPIGADVIAETGAETAPGPAVFSAAGGQATGFDRPGVAALPDEVTGAGAMVGAPESVGPEMEDRSTTPPEPGLSRDEGDRAPELVTEEAGQTSLDDAAVATGPGPAPDAPLRPARALADISARDAVRAVRAAGADAVGRAAAINDLIWCLIRDGRLGLAYHLSHHLEENLLPVEAPVGLIEALTLGPLVRSSSSEVAGRLRDCFQGLRKPASPLDLCTFAAGLRPALLAPVTKAPEVLRQIDLASEGLRKLRDVVLVPSSRNITLTPSLLKGDHQGERWSRSVEALRGRCHDWLARNRVSRVIYQPTTVVWQRWLRDDGPIGTMVGRVINNQRATPSLQAAEADILTWSNHARGPTASSYRRGAPAHRGAASADRRAGCDRHPREVRGSGRPRR